MSRSGNHAIINWILRQKRGDWLFLNCAEPETNPFDTARELTSGEAYWTSLSELDWFAEKHGRFSKKSLLIYSHEDTFLKKACGPRANALEPQFVGTAGKRTDLLILRDPFNLFASRRHLGCHSVSEAVATRIWKQHAKAFRRPRAPNGREWLPVSYNAWCSSPEYRRSLADRLGLEFTDAGFDEVSPVANGSSFDGEAYGGRGSQMQVLNRWQHYARDPAFLELFDAETRLLSHRIFGYLPLDEALYRPKP